ncbi:MAG: ArnT family glycosyltransferase, partial [Planctomycetota bacterium]
MKKNIGKSRIRTIWIPVLLLMCFVFQATLSMRQKSVTVDEIMYIAAGYYHLKTGDFHLNMTNPPLMKMVPALPLLLLNPQLPPASKDLADWNLIQQWQYARTFLYDNHVDADTLLFAARLPIVLIGLLLGFFLFRWARELYGDIPVLAVLLAFCFSPNMLAHARFATQDLAITTAMFAASYYFWTFTRDPSWKGLLLCAIAIGLGTIVKTSVVFLVPVFVGYGVLLVIRRNGEGYFPGFPWLQRIPETSARWRQFLSLNAAAVTIVLVTLLIINLGYGFQGTFSPLTQKNDLSELYEKLPLNNAVTRTALDVAMRVPIPLPEPYVESLKFQRGLGTSSAGVYFAGKVYPGGLWYIMPMSVLLKTPIPILLMVL